MEVASSTFGAGQKSNPNSRNSMGWNHMQLFEGRSIFCWVYILWIFLVRDILRRSLHLKKTLPSLANEVFRIKLSVVTSISLAGFIFFSTRAFPQLTKLPIALWMFHVPRHHIDGEWSLGAQESNPLGTPWINCCWIEGSFHFGINRGQFGGKDWSISGYVVTVSTLPSGRQMSIPVQAGTISVTGTDIVGCMCNMEAGWHVSGRLHVGPPYLHWMGRDWGLVDTLTLRSFLRVVGLSKDSDSLCEVQLGLTNCYRNTDTDHRWLLARTQSSINQKRHLQQQKSAVGKASKIVCWGVRKT